MHKKMGIIQIQVSHYKRGSSCPGHDSIVTGLDREYYSGWRYIKFKSGEVLIKINTRPPVNFKLFLII